MNKFNDIISEENAYELPGNISEAEQYREIIKKAYDFVKDILSFDDFQFEEEHDKFVIKVTSKNQVTNFKLNKNRKIIDVPNLVKGLNKALINAFYVGDGKFFDISGNIYNYGIGFISRTQRNKLFRQGLIGEIDKVEHEQEVIASEPKVINKIDVVEEEKEVGGNTRTEPKNSEESFIVEEQEISSHEVVVEDNDLLQDMRDYPDIRIFNIINQPDKYSDKVYNTAKFIAVERNIKEDLTDIYTSEFKEITALINGVSNLMKDNYSDESIVEMLIDRNIDDKTRKFIMSEAKKKTILDKDKEKEKSGSPWLLIIGIILFILKLLLRAIR